MPSNGSSHLAVVVEDDDSLREMICELLALVGFRTVGCRNGTEGLKAARELRPSVLTLDLHMPGMDGEEVLHHLSRDESTAALPVVVVSAHIQERRLKSCRQVKAIVSKPFDVNELWEKVRNAANGLN